MTTTELCKSFIVMHIIYWRLVYNYVKAAWNWANSRMRLASRGLAAPVLLYWVSAQNENEFVLECNVTCYQQTASTAFEVFKIWVMMLK